MPDRFSPEVIKEDELVVWPTGLNRIKLPRTVRKYPTIGGIPEETVVKMVEEAEDSLETAKLYADDPERHRPDPPESVTVS